MIYNKKQLTVKEESVKLGGCEPNTQVAWDYYKKSCDLGYASACLTAGMLYAYPEKDPKTNEPLIKADFVTALKYMEKACYQNIPSACYHASGLYIKGAEGVPQNRTKASELSRVACDGGNVYACLNLSIMYKRGDGVEKDEEKSLFFKEKAKELRDDMKKKPPIGFQQYT